MNNYDRRPIEPLKDAWLLDSDGKIVGVELARASNQKTYLPSSATEGAVDGTLAVNITSTSPAVTSAGVGADEGATVSAVEQGDGVVHKTVLTLASTPVTVLNVTGASFGGVKLYEFPEGRIAVLGVTANLSFSWTDASDPVIVQDGSGDFSLGTTITEDATLDGSDVDLLPSTGLLDPFVAGVGTGKGALAAAAQFDGTTTPVEANLNLIIDDADVEDDTETDVLVSGTVTITWINLGDF